MDTLASAAIDYAQRGWQVFPVEPGGKRPLGRLAPHGLKDATNDLEQVRAWWRDEPRANIGLPTGISFDVLDVDGPEGMQAIDRAAPWYGKGPDSAAPTIDGPTVVTGKGYHVYLAATGLGNRAGVLPHVDWRGLGGYVVGVPSLHETGSVYAWFEDWGIEQEIRPAPQWLLKLLRRPSVITTPVVSNGHNRAYGQAALQSEIGKIILTPVGERNHTLNKAAFAVGQLIAGGEIEDANSAVAALMQAGEAVGLEKDEIVATVRSGIDGGSLQPRKARAA